MYVLGKDNIETIRKTASVILFARLGSRQSKNFVSIRSAVRQRLLARLDSLMPKTCTPDVQVRAALKRVTRR